MYSGILEFDFTEEDICKAISVLKMIDFMILLSTSSSDNDYMVNLNCNINVYNQRLVAERINNPKTVTVLDTLRQMGLIHNKFICYVYAFNPLSDTYPVSFSAEPLRQDILLAYKILKDKVHCSKIHVDIVSLKQQIHDLEVKIVNHELYDSILKELCNTISHNESLDLERRRQELVDLLLKQLDDFKSNLFSSLEALQNELFKTVSNKLDSLNRDINNYNLDDTSYKVGSSTLNSKLASIRDSLKLLLAKCRNASNEQISLENDLIMISSLVEDLIRQQISTNDSIKLSYSNLDIVNKRLSLIKDSMQIIGENLTKVVSLSDDSAIQSADIYNQYVRN